VEYGWLQGAEGNFLGLLPPPSPACGNHTVAAARRRTHSTGEAVR